MLQERNYVVRQTLMAVDLAIGVAVFFLAHWARTRIVSPWLLPTQVEIADDWYAYQWILFLTPPLAVIALRLTGAYDLRRMRERWRESRSVILSVAAAAIVTYLLTALFREEGRVSRLQTGLALLLYYPLLELRTSLTRGVMAHRRRMGRDRLNALLVGSGPPLEELIETLESHSIWGFQMTGVVSDSEALKQGEAVRGVPVLGPLEDALSILRSHQIDEVIVTPGHAGLEELAPLMNGCEEMGVRAHLALNSFEHTIATPTFDMLRHIAVATYSPVRSMGPLLLVKHLLDRLAAMILLVLLSWLILFIAIAIKLTSKRGEPVFFRQTRCGRNGKPFTLLKFRTMRVGAEEERAALDFRNEADGPVFKMRNDPRLTVLGPCLRRHSLDELPQLWNVFRGDMSLVGPRPALPDEVNQYEPWQRRRLSMRPGVTCLWQVGGRSNLSFETWMRLDLRYIDHWSLWLDMKILARTALTVLFPSGAM